jgi:hypothetical protein
VGERAMERGRIIPKGQRGSEAPATSKSYGFGLREGWRHSCSIASMWWPDPVPRANREVTLGALPTEASRILACRVSLVSHPDDDNGY